MTRRRRNRKHEDWEYEDVEVHCRYCSGHGASASGRCGHCNGKGFTVKRKLIKDDEPQLSKSDLNALLEDYR